MASQVYTQPAQAGTLNIRNQQGLLPPVGTSIQTAADQLVSLIKQEQEAAVQYEKGQYNHLERLFSSYREHQEKVYAMQSYENKKLSQELEQLKQLNTSAREETLPQRPILEVQLRNLEDTIVSLQNERDHLQHQLQTYMKQSTAVMNQLGLHNPSPGLFSFNKNWPAFLLEVGIDCAQHYDPGQLQAALLHAAITLRQLRGVAILPMPYQGVPIQNLQAGDQHLNSCTQPLRSGAQVNPPGPQYANTPQADSFPGLEDHSHANASGLASTISAQGEYHPQPLL